MVGLYLRHINREWTAHCCRQYSLSTLLLSRWPTLCLCRSTRMIARWPTQCCHLQNIPFEWCWMCSYGYSMEAQRQDSIECHQLKKLGISDSHFWILSTNFDHFLWVPWIQKGQFSKMSQYFEQSVVLSYLFFDHWIYHRTIWKLSVKFLLVRNWIVWVKVHWRISRDLPLGTWNFYFLTRTFSWVLT